MSTQSKTSFSHQRRVLIIQLAAVIVLCLSGTTHSAVAQDGTIVTTLTPWSVVTPGPVDATFKTKQPVLLRFRRSAFPPNTTVTSARLRLVHSRRGESGPITIKSYFFPTDPAGNSATVDEAQMRGWLNQPNTPFGDRGLNGNEPSVSQPWAEWKPTTVPGTLKAGGTSFAVLLLPSDASADERIWHSLTASDSHLRPRLILEYTVAGRTPTFESQGLPAVKSPTAYLPDPVAGAGFASRDVTSLWSYLPVFYKGLVYVINQNKLQALPALGGPPVWESTPLSNIGQHLLMSEAGRLYIAGNQNILVYQLDPAKGIPSASGQPLISQSMAGFDFEVAPAVGADGSLYFVNSKQVYGLSPDLQELWMITLDKIHPSRITVGPSGQFVYLLGMQNGAMKLIAIDARTGETSSALLPNSDQLLDTPTLHAPVVLLQKDGTEEIYAAADSTDAGAIAAFDNPLTRPKHPSDAKLVAAEKWNPISGQFSQPTAIFAQPASTADSAANIYSVQVTGSQGQLRAFSWVTGTASSVGAPFSVDASSMLTTGNLVTDRSGNIFIWTSQDSKLYAFGKGAAGFAAPSLGSLKVNSRLLFGSDGTLYAYEPANNDARILRAIVPQYSLSTESSGTIASPTNVSVTGVATRNTTISAPGNIFLGNGFRVPQGKTLSVKQPKQ